MAAHVELETAFGDLAADMMKHKRMCMSLDERQYEIIEQAVSDPSF